MLPYRTQRPGSRGVRKAWERDWGVMVRTSFFLSEACQEQSNLSPPAAAYELHSSASPRLAPGATILSVPGRCFTKQTGDMVYRMAENSWLPGLGWTHEDAFMPWKETRTVDQCLQFLSSYQKEEMSVTD